MYKQTNILNWSKITPFYEHRGKLLQKQVENQYFLIIFETLMKY
jgi:hypothetical protein